MTDLPKLIRRVERYMRKHDMTASSFGVACKNNPALVPRLRAGNVTMTTINHVVKWLDEEAASDAAEEAA